MGVIMRTQLACIPCFIEDVLSAADGLIADEAEKERVMKSLLRCLAEHFTTEVPPSYHITRLHRRLKRLTGIEMPFKKRRQAANEAGVKLARIVAQKLDGMKGFERFSFLARWALAGNSMDFRHVGTGYHFDSEKVEDFFSEALETPAVNKLKQIYSLLRRVRHILYIHDNVGEIALDKLLIEELKGWGKYVVSVVRGGPITSDVVIEDAEFVGIPEVADEVIIAGPDTLGISFAEMNDRMRRELNKADAVIIKGQANFYVFCEYKDQVPGEIISLFRTKCDCVSNLFGHSGHINIATIL
jgi:hypothetical protein